MTDHDQRFKTLIREFFAEFLSLFFADWAQHMELNSIEWLDKELFPDPPEGTRHAIDLVAKLPVSFPSPDDQPISDVSMLLIHIEIEAPDRMTRLKSRMPFYYHFLRDKYQLPVLPIVLYLHVGLDGIGSDTQVERVWNMIINQFQYLYVGLPGLDGVQYVQQENWLGVALSALMNIPTERVAWLGAEALRRLAGAPLTEQRKYLLGECVETYLELDDSQRQTFEKILTTKEYENVRTINKTTYEKGLEQGRRQDRLELAVSVIERHFGPVSSQNVEAIEAKSMDDLFQLIVNAGTVSSLSELGLADNE